MATPREKQLAITLLKERIEHSTGKKVMLRELTPDERKLQQQERREDDSVFEIFWDTDANGSAFEMMIDELIQEAKERINDGIKQIAGGNPQTDGATLRIAVKRLWMEKIKQWKSNE